ncbi:MAG: gamma-glutamyl-gamma-aminobutyrate hydrolase family protein [Planctomycetota bacterium]
MTMPLIGIDVDLTATPSGRRYAKCYETYFDAVSDAGGAPVLLTPCPEPAARRVLSAIQGVVVPGGDDFAADEWGEVQRDCPRFTPSDPRRLIQGKLLMRLVLEQRVPFLGVCYGAQLMNLALGGSLLQDLPTDLAEPLPHHTEPHDVRVTPGSLLAKLTGVRSMQINSRHHQANQRLGDGLRISAQAPDGVVEAVEAQDPEHFLLGVQWHAEELGDQPGGAPVFQGLVEAAKARAV